LCKYKKSSAAPAHAHTRTQVRDATPTCTLCCPPPSRTSHLAPLARAPLFCSHHISWTLLDLARARVAVALLRLRRAYTYTTHQFIIRYVFVTHYTLQITNYTQYKSAPDPSVCSPYIIIRFAFAAYYISNIEHTYGQQQGLGLRGRFLYYETHTRRTKILYSTRGGGVVRGGYIFTDCCSFIYPELSTRAHICPHTCTAAHDDTDAFTQKVYIHIPHETGGQPGRAEPRTHAHTPRARWSGFERKR